MVYVHVYSTLDIACRERKKKRKKVSQHVIDTNCRWTLRFIQSDFKGQLPQLYSRHSNSTSVIPDHMNDMNLEEPSRYVS